MAVLLVALDSLFRDNAFDMDAANRYIARIKNCPKSSIDAFHTVLTTVDPKQTKTGSIVLLIQQDDVFDDSADDSKTLDSLLARIRQIPKEAVA